MILTPDKLWTRAEVLSKPCPVPREGGVYGWYFDAVPPGIVTANHHTVGKASLLYIGISPKAPPKNGAKPSKQTMRERIRYHYQGNAEGSTLRLTLGCLLSEELDIEFRRVGSGKRMTFAEGEEVLSPMDGRQRFCVLAARRRALVERKRAHRRATSAPQPRWQQIESIRRYGVRA